MDAICQAFDAARVHAHSLTAPVPVEMVPSLRIMRSLARASLELA
jgi:hypothetical protein